MVPTMNSKEILWPDKQLTDQIQKAKEIQRRTLSRRPLWSNVTFRSDSVLSFSSCGLYLHQSKQGQICKSRLHL